MKTILTFILGCIASAWAHAGDLPPMTPAENQAWTKALQHSTNPVTGQYKLSTQLPPAADHAKSGANLRRKSELQSAPGPAGNATGGSGGSQSLIPPKNRVPSN